MEKKEQRWLGVGRSEGAFQQGCSLFLVSKQGFQHALPDEGKLSGTLKMFAMVKQVRLQHFKMLAALGWVAREVGLRRRVNPGESQFFKHLRVEAVEGERRLQSDGSSLMIRRVGLCVDLAGQQEHCLLLRKPVAERFEQAAHLL